MFCFFFFLLHLQLCFIFTPTSEQMELNHRFTIIWFSWWQGLRNNFDNGTKLIPVSCWLELRKIYGRWTFFISIVRNWNIYIIIHFTDAFMGVRSPDRMNCCHFSCINMILFTVHQWLISTGAGHVGLYEATAGTQLKIFCLIIKSSPQVFCVSNPSLI